MCPTMTLTPSVVIATAPPDLLVSWYASRVGLGIHYLFLADFGFIQEFQVSSKMERFDQHYFWLLFEDYMNYMSC